MKRTIPTDVNGLNRVLGGGVAVVKRYPDYGESATLLIRGPPGSGKTVFGVQLAGSLARQLGCDAAYGCVELLPSELEVQHAGIRRPEVKERMVLAPFPNQGPKGEECRIFAEMLAIGPSGEETAKLGDAIERVLAAIERAGGQARVLVIDSLSDGYNLGSSAPRVLADALCKMAVERGMVFILLEEIVESKPSVWSFAADCVIELGLEREERAGEQALIQRLAIRKNRFGACEPGPHRFIIADTLGFNIIVSAPPTVDISLWIHGLTLPRPNPLQTHPQSWTPPASNVPDDWPPFFECVTAIYGSEAHAVFAIANKLGTTTKTGERASGVDIFLDFNSSTTAESPERVLIGCANPFITSDWLVSEPRASASAILSSDRTIRRVLIGDLLSTRTFRYPVGVRQALMVLVSVLRKANVPVILFETSWPRTIERFIASTGVIQEETTAALPPIVDVADVVIEIVKKTPTFTDPRPNIFMTHIRSGRVVSWESEAT